MIERNAISHARLRELAGQAMGRPVDDLGCWDLQPLHYDASSPTSLGLYRLNGWSDGTGWSLILKAVRAPGGVEIAPGRALPMWVDDLPPTEFSYWKREICIYRSGMLDRLPGGIAAPRCFGVDEVAPKVFWLWLEDVTDADDNRWSLARCVETARHLGRLNGSYTAGHPLPAQPWLQRGWLRSWMEPGRPGSVWLEMSSDVAGIFPPTACDRLARLWDEREAILDALDQLPLCFCHRDAWPPNLLIRWGAGGRRETVALDWAFAGIGPVGEEIAPLIVWSGLPDSDLRDVESRVLAAYRDGLREGGWDGDPAVVRFGYAATAVLRYTFITARNVVRAVLRARDHADRGGEGADSIEHTVAQNARVVDFLLDHVDEVCSGLRAGM